MISKMKVSKFLRITHARSRRLTRVLMLSVTAWLVICLYYYNFFETMKIFPRTTFLDKLQNMETLKVNEDFLIDTPGCTIPNYAKTLHFNETVPKVLSCGQRAVFINKMADNKIQFYIDDNKMQLYSKKSNYSCCYKFVSRSNVSGKEDSSIQYSKCMAFKNGTKLFPVEEVITINCFVNKHYNTKSIYDDAYIIVKKINRNQKDDKKETKWNILLLGMDTMSRTRAYDSLPKTVQYMKRHGWLDFRAYHKVGFNTFPNVIPFLTGLNQSNIYNACNYEYATEKNLMMWSKFKSRGYVTAFGEDDLKCPDTFTSCSRIQRPLRAPPTDHYMRPLFLTGEHEVGYLTCTKKMSSVEHLLNYAFDYTAAYKNEPFFGLFWMNSFSHGLDRKPPQIDTQIENLFRRLNENGILQNTFVVFFGDHGVRYGEMRYKIETHFEDRLPMFFMWLPDQFRKLYPVAISNAIINQYRLSSPYDLYSTLVDILRLSNSSVNESKPEGCPQCSSVFVEKSELRTCANAGVSDKWCACHNLKPVTDVSEYGPRESTKSFFNSLNDMIKTIKTINCTKCSKLTLHKLLRIHSHGIDGKIYYVIAIIVKPTLLAYEGTIVMDNGIFEVINTGHSITTWPISKRGNCTAQYYGRAHCFCLETKCKSKNEN